MNIPRSQILLYYNSHEISMMKIILNKLAEFFSSQGFNIRWLDMGDNNWIQKMNGIVGKPISFSIGFNAIGAEMKANKQYLSKLYNYPQVVFLTEVPYHFLADFIQNCTDNNTILLCLEEDHSKYINTMYPRNKMNINVMPWAGVENKQYSEKKNDIMYCAGYKGIPVREWETDNITAKMRDYLSEIAYLLERLPINVYDAAKRVIRYHNKPIESVEIFYKYFPYLFNYSKAYRRYTLIKYIATQSDLPLIVYGEGWDEFPYAGNLKVKGRIDYENLILLYKQTKILLHDNAAMNNTIHERIFSGMLNKALVISENGKTIADTFADNKNIVLYNWEHLDKVIQEAAVLLKDDDLRERIINNAYDKVTKFDTWQQRGESILRLVENWYNMNY